MRGRESSLSPECLLVEDTKWYDAWVSDKSRAMLLLQARRRECDTEASRDTRRGAGMGIVSFLRTSSGI